jgi:sugar O-acyltransferase (sialic acid O-acetyltransferase NeuD family)
MDLTQHISKAPVIIVGLGILAQTALEILQRNDIVVYGFLSEKELTPELTEINHIPILGSLEEDATYIEKLGKDCAVFVALEQSHARQRYIQSLVSNKQNCLLNLIHPSAEIASTARIGAGDFLDSGCRLGPNVHLGDHCLLHKQVVVGGGTVIQDFVQIGAGSIVGEEVTLEENVFIGAGVTIASGLHIGTGAQVGAGSVVLESIKPKEMVLGNPARPFKK